MEILLLLIMALANILCFMVGAKVGQAVTKGEKVELPKVNPVTVIREHRAAKEAEREQDRLSVIMQNIEGYDGTAYGQQEVPRG